jgi:hypothetical protein
MRALFPLLAILSFSSTCTAQATYDARIVQYVGTTYACDGTVTPVMKIINNGTETMIGCVVETWKNGLLDNSFDWQLPLPAAEGQVRTPAFPAVDAVSGDELEFRIISVNGVPDEVADGNSHVLNVVEAPLSESPLVRVEVVTDDMPEETSWVIRTASYATIASGGPYTEANTSYEQWLELDPFVCYLFEVLDAGGNGLSSGFVRVSSLEVNVLEVLPETFTLRSEGFVTGDAAGFFEARSQRQVGLYPNPSTGHITLDTSPFNPSDLRITVSDLTGRTVLMQDLLNSNSTLPIDLSDLAPGRYHVGVNDGTQNTAVAIVVLTN